MSALSFWSSFIWPRAPSLGSLAPKLSLTSDNGAWIRSIDFVETNCILLLFFPHLGEEETKAWLKSYSERQDEFEALDTQIFGVTPSTIDKLRGLREDMGLSFSLLYDPMALDARRFGMTGRRPYIKAGAVMIDKAGRISHGKWAHTAPEELLGLLREGQTETVESDELQEVKLISSDFAISLMEQDYRMIDVRTIPEFEADHVPNSLHLPLDELNQRHAELGDLERLIFICQAGGRAYNAAEFVTSIGGLDISVVEGGMSGWNGPRMTGGKSTEA
jgi:rhodanese-related sulfurtransferase/peroxiredoxin